MKIIKWIIQIPYRFITLLLIIFSALLISMKKFDFAIRTLQNAIWFNVYKYMICTNLSMIYLANKKNLEKAFEYISLGLKDKPNYFYLLINLSYYYLKKEDYQKALKTLEPARKIFMNGYVRNNKAVAFIRLKDYDKAQAELNKISRFSPMYFFALYNQSIIDQFHGQFDEAIKNCKKALRKRNLKSFTYTLALYYAQNNQFDESLKSLKEYINKNTDAFIFDEDISLWNKALDYQKENNHILEITKIISSLPQKSWSQI